MSVRFTVERQERLGKRSEGVHIDPGASGVTPAWAGRITLVDDLGQPQCQPLKRSWSDAVVREDLRLESGDHDLDDVRGVARFGHVDDEDLRAEALQRRRRRVGRRHRHDL